MSESDRATPDHPNPQPDNCILIRRASPPSASKVVSEADCIHFCVPDQVVPEEMEPLRKIRNARKTAQTYLHIFTHLHEHGEGDVKKTSFHKLPPTKARHLSEKLHVKSRKPILTSGVILGWFLMLFRGA